MTAIDARGYVRGANASDFDEDARASPPHTVEQMENASSGHMAVRRATTGDADALAVLRYDFRAAIAAPAEDVDAFVARCSTWMSTRLGAPTWRCWVAERSVDVEEVAGELVGAVWLQMVEKIPNPVDEPETLGYVTSFYVRESARNRGVGSALLGAAIRDAEAAGVGELFLWPTPKSRSLYERLGFRSGDVMSRARTPDRAGA